MPRTAHHFIKTYSPPSIFQIRNSRRELDRLQAGYKNDQGYRSFETAFCGVEESMGAPNYDTQEWACVKTPSCPAMGEICVKTPCLL